MNLVEALAAAAEEHRGAPCIHGDIVDSHTCYCHHHQGPRKCPIWRNYGEQPDKWHNRGDWDDDNWTGGCPYFEPAP